MRKNYKYMMIPVLWSMMKGLHYLLLRPRTNMSDLVISLGLSEPYFTSGYIHFIIYSLFPMLMFQIMFGTYIYEHFCIASVYYFSRQNNKTKWFIREALLLFMYSYLYHIIYFFAAIAISSASGSIVADRGWLILLFYIIHYFSLWSFIVCLCVNVLSIWWGSHYAFMTIHCIQISLVFVLGAFDTMLSVEKGIGRILFMFNPISNLVVTWHHSAQEEISSKINILGIHFHLNQSLIYFFILGAVAVAWGSCVVRRTDIALENKELQG